MPKVQFRHFRHFFKYHAFSKKYLAIKCNEITIKNLGICLIDVIIVLVNKNNDIYG